MTFMKRRTIKALAEAAKYKEAIHLESLPIISHYQQP